MSSESEYDSSSSSSDEEPVISKPIFTKKKPVKESAEPKSLAKDAVMSKAEHEQQIAAKETSQDFDGVDDTDNLDPEGEFEQWQQRERERKKQYYEQLRETEEEKEDKVREKMA